MKKYLLLGVLVFALILAGCGGGSAVTETPEAPTSQQASQGEPSQGQISQEDAPSQQIGQEDAPSQQIGQEKPTYQQISQEEAKEMMEADGTQIILDVRTQEEYDSGHIPGAICIPVESIGTEQPAELPDLDQVILIYCRSGRRSKEAAGKLATIGYTNLYEFGGINTWTGETVAAEEDSTEDEIAEAVQPVPELVLKANGKTFYADLEDNSSADALIEKLESGEVTVDLHDYGNFEKVGPLPWELPRNDEDITTEPGDVILYQGNQITVYYDTNSWSFTRLAKIEDVTKEELLEAFGEGDVSVSLSVEWSE